MNKEQYIKDLEKIIEGWKKLNADNEILRDKLKKCYFELKEQIEKE